MGKRAWFELGLGVAGSIYLALVFIRNIYSPLLALVLVTLAGYDLIGSHARTSSSHGHWRRRSFPRLPRPAIPFPGGW